MFTVPSTGTGAPLQPDVTGSSMVTPTMSVPGGIAQVPEPSQYTVSGEMETPRERACKAMAGWPPRASVADTVADVAPAGTLKHAPPTPTPGCSTGPPSTTVPGPQQTRLSPPPT